MFFHFAPKYYGKRKACLCSRNIEYPGNILLVYPQGNLESNHVRHIGFKFGIAEIISQIKGNCQLIWSSNLIQYFESLKPSVYFYMLDCGSNADFDFCKMVDDINNHHKEAVKKKFRFTEEGAVF